MELPVIDYYTMMNIYDLKSDSLDYNLINKVWTTVKSGILELEIQYSINNYNSFRTRIKRKYEDLVLKSMIKQNTLVNYSKLRSYLFLSVLAFVLFFLTIILLSFKGYQLLLNVEPSNAEKNSMLIIGIFTLVSLLIGVIFLIIYISSKNKIESFVKNSPAYKRKTRNYNERILFTYINKCDLNENNINNDFELISRFVNINYEKYVPNKAISNYSILSLEKIQWAFICYNDIAKRINSSYSI
jgi:hypothetical protein